jgi:glycosyltransferase involved in cell wall biosynthesis
MNILWLSNAPWASTGYGNQTRLFTPRIKAMGHNLAICAFYGLEGGLLTTDGIPVFPKGKHAYGIDIAAEHGRSFGAQVIISLIDAWVMDGNMLQQYGLKWVPWYPVDMEPLAPPIKAQIARAYRRIVFSRYGERITQEAGLDCFYVPHGVETDIYKPVDRVQARERLKLPTDKFIVGMVAANKGFPPRKAFYQNIEAYARFHKKHPDTLLYLHTQPGAGAGGNVEVNLIEYCNSVGLSGADDVRFAHPYQLWMGYPEPSMVDIYNSMDVHLLVSMGEGFGIPILEAQACGTPVIVGDWTAMSELCFGGWKVDKKDSEPTWQMLAAYQFTPRVEPIVERLEAAYRVWGNNDYRERARAGAMKYDANRVAEKYWKPVLSEIEQDINAWAPQAVSP